MQVIWECEFPISFQVAVPELRSACTPCDPDTSPLLQPFSDQTCALPREDLLFSEACARYSQPHGASSLDP